MASDFSRNLPGARVKWNGATTARKTERFREAVVNKLAFDLESKVKLKITDNDQVDTGFMRNSTYTATASGASSPGAKSGRYHSRRTGRSVKRVAARTVKPGRKDAVVHVGAIYAIYQERRRPFVRPSVESMRGAIGNIARVEWRRVK